jgi:hypothetical protein
MATDALASGGAHDWGMIVFALISVLVPLYWGRWWYAQRIYFRR